MRSITDFIVFTDVVFTKTFKTESGLELHGDSRFLQNRLAQREVVIKEMPLNYKGDSLIGYQALIDPTIYYRNLYDHGQGDNNEVKGLEGCFKIQPNMIIAIRKDDQSEWIGFEGNLVVEQLMDKNEEKKSGLIITEIARPKTIQGLGRVFVTNDSMLLDDVNVGDTIRFSPKYGVTIYLNGKELMWIRTKDCLAKVS